MEMKKGHLQEDMRMALESARVQAAADTKIAAVNNKDPYMP